MAGPFQQTANTVQRAAMWMKEPEQWFAIVRALGMSFLLIYGFNLLMTVYRSATPLTMMIMMTRRHHTVCHLTTTNVPGEQGTGIREWDSRRISSPRCVFFFFFFLLFYLLLLLLLD